MSRLSETAYPAPRPRCEEEASDRAAEALANHINPFDERIEEGVLSSCCRAGMRLEAYDYGVCPETGYHDQGDRLVCVQCRETAEESAEYTQHSDCGSCGREGVCVNGTGTCEACVELGTRQPVSRQQGELSFVKGVA